MGLGPQIHPNFSGFFFDSGAAFEGLGLPKIGQIRELCKIQGGVFLDAARIGARKGSKH